MRSALIDHLKLQDSYRMSLGEVPHLKIIHGITKFQRISRDYMELLGNTEGFSDILYANFM